MPLHVYVLGISDTWCRQVNNRALVRAFCFKEPCFSGSEWLTFASLARLTEAGDAQPALWLQFKSSYLWITLVSRPNSRLDRPPEDSSFFGQGLPFLSAILKLRLVIKRQPIYPNYNIDERLNACTCKCRSRTRKADLGTLIYDVVPQQLPLMSRPLYT